MLLLEWSSGAFESQVGATVTSVPPVKGPPSGKAENVAGWEGEEEGDTISTPTPLVVRPSNTPQATETL